MMKIIKQFSQHYGRYGALLIGLGVIISFALLLSFQRGERIHPYSLDQELNGGQAKEFSLYKLGNRNAPEFGDYFLDRVQPLLAKRCVVCHSCTNGPCQLNMTSYKAIERGIHKIDPYGLTVSEKVDTRIANNRTIEHWRSVGFEPILPGDESGLAPEESILYRNLIRGQTNTYQNPAFQEQEIRRMGMAHESSIYECSATPKEYALYEAKYPQGGMPCGLPALPADEFKILVDWVKSGGLGPSKMAQEEASNPQLSGVSKENPVEVIRAWDEFLNGSLESQLVARYLFEHLFLGNIHFEENPGEFYRLVRSSTPYPYPIQQIATETVQDAPPTEGRVYYRMQKIDRVIEAKTHIVWRLSRKSLEHWKEVFLQKWPWKIASLPGYESKNPFAVFEPIPTKARAQFMRENFRLLRLSIGKGPVCFEQVSTYALDSYIFMMMLKPEADPTVMNPKLGLKSWNNFFTREYQWRGMFLGDNRFGEVAFKNAFERELRRLRPHGLSIDDIWDGEDGKKDPNALVVGRRFQRSVEFDTAETKNLTGMPNSVALATYATSERYHYNILATYKYWGNLIHKHDTWEFSMYLRTEEEDLYISLLPDQAYRDEVRARLTSPMGRRYFNLDHDYAQGRPANTKESYNEDMLLRAILKKFGPTIVGPEDTLNNWPNTNLPQKILPAITNIEEWEQGLRAITAKSGIYPRYFPNIAYVRIGGANGELYSLTTQRAYSPHKLSLFEKSSRRPDDDVIHAYHGLMGIAPELFFDLSFENASSFLKELQAVHDPESSAAFFSKYKIARNSPKFWSFADWLHAWQEKNMPIEGGILEFRFYDLTDVPF
ncbi:MAG: fatty acid cis/trans isomerase [Oligoflexia bacterium]|nr:fatty acid cis/trans isomerase [Oligoflexia bacterium]